MRGRQPAKAQRDRSSIAKVRDARTEITIGAEIREVRQARGLTLKDLSRMSGRSVAHLSKIERGSTRLTVELLADISSALKVDPKWFFPSRTGHGPLERSCVVRAQARRPLSGLYTRSFAELGFADELLSSTLTGSFYLCLSTFPPSVRDVSPNRELYAFEGEQHGLVMKGQLELRLGDEIIELRAGDSFSFSSEIPHRLQTIGDEETTVVWGMAPVRISW